MKGTSFQKPLEFKLAVEGESWKQGETLSGTLTVKNHGAEPADLSGLRTALAYANLEDVRTKVPDAFEFQAATELKPTGQLAPQQEETFEWKIQLDRNSPITDKSRSLFLLYGQGEAPVKLGQLQLVVVPVTIIQDFLNLMSIDFKFVVKILKFNKNAVEAKFTPPSAKEFSAVENLFISFRFDGDQLQLRYLFNIKKLDASAGMEMKKDKKEFKQEFIPNQYLLSNGRLNHEKIGPAVQEILGELGVGSLL